MTHEEAKKMGATHFHEKCDDYYKLEGDLIYIWNDEWMLDLYNPPLLSFYLKPL